jgi:DNA-binding NarL/FixJ family response regulator
MLELGLMSVLSTPLSILLVEDDRRFRTGIRTLLNFYQEQGSGHFAVIGEADSAETALALIEQQTPDLILLDLELSTGSGMMVLRQLQQHGSTAKTLVISAHQEDSWIFQAMGAGAVGYVFKIALARQLWDAIATVIQGEIYLPPEVATAFFRQFQQIQAAAAAQSEQPCVTLSTREIEVLTWLARGVSNERIGEHLYISVATVKAHLTSIFQKLKVHSRSQAIVAAIKMGLIQP